MNSLNGEVSEIALVPSGGGVFEVTVDGKLIYSKRELKRFPEKQEVTTIIKS
jgi:selenoprotein W-related protein